MTLRSTKRIAAVLILSLRLKRINRFAVSAALSACIGLSHLVPVVIPIGVVATQTACPSGIKTESDIEKVENKLDKAVNGLNALAKTARELYRENVINLPERQLAGKIIEEANDGLEAVSDRVIQVDLNNPESVKLGKVDVENLLKKVIEKLNQFGVGGSKLQLGAAAIILTINDAIDLVKQVKEVRN